MLSLPKKKLKKCSDQSVRESERERDRKTKKQRHRDIESCFKKECRDRKESE